MKVRIFGSTVFFPGNTKFAGEWTVGDGRFRYAYTPTEKERDALRKAQNIPVSKMTEQFDVRSQSYVMIWEGEV